MTTQVVKEGDLLKDFHCKGFTTEILYVCAFSDGSEQATGRCNNPNCTTLCGCGHAGCMYNGIINIDNVDHPELWEKEVVAP